MHNNILIISHNVRREIFYPLMKRCCTVDQAPVDYSVQVENPKDTRTSTHSSAKRKSEKTENKNKKQ